VKLSWAREVLSKGAGSVGFAVPQVVAVAGTVDFVFLGAVCRTLPIGSIANMAASTDIDPDATGTGLAASAASRTNAVAAGAVSLPQGLYVSATNTLAEGLIAARLADLSTRVAFGAGTAQASVSSYKTTEEANAAALKT
jgi:hypothetical protein